MPLTSFKYMKSLDFSMPDNDTLSTNDFNIVLAKKTTTVDNTVFVIWMTIYNSNLCSFAFFHHFLFGLFGALATGINFI